MMKGRIGLWICFWLLATAIAWAKPPASYDEGNALYQKGDYAGAKARFQQAIADGFDKAATHYKIGLCERKMGNYEEALAQFEQALRMEPGYASRSNIDKMTDDVRAKLGRQGTEQPRPETTQQPAAVTTPPRSTGTMPSPAAQAPVVAQARGGVNWFGWIVLLLIAVWVIWLFRLRGKKKSIEASFEEARSLGMQIGGELGQIKQDIALIPPSVSSTRLKEHYDQVEKAFIEASDTLQRATTGAEADRARWLLKNARAKMEGLQQAVRTAKTGLEAPSPTPSSGQGKSVLTSAPSASPRNKMACFFCSRPDNQGPLRSVALETDRGVRKVLACQSCAADIERGRAPSVRSVYYEDRYVPWYQVPDYDPYVDYSSPRWQVDLLDLMLIDSLFRHHTYAGPTVIFADDDPYRDQMMYDAAAHSFDHDTALEGPLDSGGMDRDTADTDTDIGDDQS